MRKVHHLSTEYTNWESQMYDLFDNANDSYFNEFLIEKMAEINASPIIFQGTLSGMRFEDDRHHTLFLMRYS